ncbi:AFG2-interacting ribosome maturation factor [Corythoichthys intestinalis]|uniref:AFG2-interacting ribosome maturation factor n=1 Tax=Corythoichthys intestinalis TaxID=161448 RepID=UPI0025A4DE80|nr:ribosome biogenesis protein C1orf109 homolog [Corythoichthys intestinalis]XP_061808226.1 AFG2-interacting ribosome maturation factor-like [Nerophis lumbriciformis]
MSKPALLTVHQALRKSFQNLENNQKTWASVLAECTPLMASLENLAEQSRALSNIQLSDTPLKDFPEVEDLLRFKLSQAMDTVLCKLHQNMASFQSLRDSISNQVSTVVQLYEQNLDSLDLATVTERSAVIPSVVDMLEWLQDAERHYRQQFMRRKILLHALSSDNLKILGSATTKWKDLENPRAEDQITDALCKVSFFMESK